MQGLARRGRQEQERHWRMEVKDSRSQTTKQEQICLCLHCRRGKINLMERVIKHSFPIMVQPVSYPAALIHVVMLLHGAARMKKTTVGRDVTLHHFPRLTFTL